MKGNYLPLAGSRAAANRRRLAGNRTRSTEPDNAGGRAGGHQRVPTKALQRALWRFVGGCLLREPPVPPPCQMRDAVQEDVHRTCPVFADTGIRAMPSSSMPRDLGRPSRGTASCAGAAQGLEGGPSRSQRRTKGVSVPQWPPPQPPGI